jgi:hypothetical protein
MSGRATEAIPCGSHNRGRPSQALYPSWVLWWHGRCCQRPYWMELPVTVYTPGTYVCVNIGGFVGWCIKHATHSDADHVGVVIDSDGTFLESQPDKIRGRTGAHINNVREYDGMPMWVSTNRIAAAPAQMLAVANSDFVGIRYGFPDIALLGVQTTFHFTPWPMDKIVLSENRMICSQLVATFGRHFGMDWNCGQKSDQYVTPGMLKNRGTVPLA